MLFSLVQQLDHLFTDERVQEADKILVFVTFASVPTVEGTFRF